MAYTFDTIPRSEDFDLVLPGGTYNAIIASIKERPGENCAILVRGGLVPVHPNMSMVDFEKMKRLMLEVFDCHNQSLEISDSERDQVVINAKKPILYRMVTPPAWYREHPEVRAGFASAMKRILGEAREFYCSFDSKNVAPAEAMGARPHSGLFEQPV